MAATFAGEPWPLGLDTGADLQFIHDDYCQPPAREPPKSTEIEKAEEKDTNEDEEKTEADEDKTEAGEDENQENENEQAEDEKYEDAGAEPDEIAYKKSALLRVSRGFATEYYELPDLKVVLNTNRHAYSFLVSSHALSIASKVWKRILNPQGFKELETQTLSAFEAGLVGERTVKIMHLEDDDVLALDLIFQILHLKTEAVLSKMSFGFLRRIAIVSDKYECGKALNPWPKMWMMKYEALATTPRYEDWTFIAKALNSKDTKVKAISTALVLDVSSKSQCGKYLRRDLLTPPNSKVEVDLELVPDGLLEYVIKERSKAVHTIITMLRQFVSDLASVNHSSGSSGLIRSKLCDNEMCSDLAVGSLIRNLKASKLWPLLSSGTPHDWHGSVRALVKRIEGLKMTTLIRPAARAPPQTVPSNLFGTRTPAPTTTSTTTSTTSNASGGSLFGGTSSSANSLFGSVSTSTSTTSAGPAAGGPDPFRPAAASPSPFLQAAATLNRGFGGFGGSSSTSSTTQPSVNPFGQPSPSLFGTGTTTNISRPASTAAFGQTASTSAFGQTASTSAFGQSVTGQAGVAASRTTQSQSNTNSSSKDNKTGETRIPVRVGALNQDGFAEAISDLRYGYPAFDALPYSTVDRPCASAFALGDLIEKCRKIVRDISAGGYEET